MLFSLGLTQEAPTQQKSPSRLRECQSLPLISSPSVKLLPSAVGAHRPFSLVWGRGSPHANEKSGSWGGGVSVCTALPAEDWGGQAMFVQSWRVEAGRRSKPGSASGVWPFTGAGTGPGC